MNNKTKEDLEHILDNFKKYILISSSSSEVTSWRKDIGMIYFNYKNNFDYLYDVVSGLINNNNLFYNHKIRNEVINISCEDGFMHELDSEYKKLVEKAVTLGIDDFDYSIYDEDGLKNKIFQKTHVKMRKKKIMKNKFEDWMNNQFAPWVLRVVFGINWVVFMLILGQLAFGK